MNKYSDGYDINIAGIGNAVAKVILYICMTVVACVWFSSCQLDKDVIEMCKSSCKTYGSSMESVTSSKCICSQPSSVESEKKWVIPTR